MSLPRGFCEAIEIASLNSPVVDEVGILSSSTKNQLENSLIEFKKNSGVQLQVYVIKSLQGDSIESIAIQVFDKWQLGDAKTDKGLLFLVAPNEKRMRIEVGQGLEGDIPDVIAKRIISDVVRPYFQRGEFGLGVTQGILTLQNYISNTDPEQKAQMQAEAQNQSSKKQGSNWIIFIVIGIWLIIFMINPSLAMTFLFMAMRGGGGGSGGSGGSWSGGGGRSSGGGSSGGW